ncbi:hypothetical protein FHG87_013504 [Trinorchestia longiramus]|nr:hypothetical protein FHG87_013504 [Trinorchestia longiramus]
MVQQEDIRNKKSQAGTTPGMGQAGMCGINAPVTDSEPTSPASAESNGTNPKAPCERTAAEVQETLTSLANVDGVSKEDLISKLRSVVNKNLELKESLAQNNLALRHQLALVVRWSQQCQLQQQHQHQQLARAAMHISALQQENASLRAAGKADGSSGGASTVEVAGLQARLSAALQQITQLQQEKDQATALKAGLEADVTLLKCDLATSRHDHERLELERSHLHATNTELKNQLRLHHLTQRQGSSEEGGKKVSAEAKEEADAARAQVEALQCDLQRALHKISVLESAAAAAAHRQVS